MPCHILFYVQKTCPVSQIMYIFCKHITNIIINVVIDRVLFPSGVLIITVKN